MIRVSQRVATYSCACRSAVDGLASEHQDDHLDKAQTVGTMDNGTVESGE